MSLHLVDGNFHLFLCLLLHVSPDAGGMWSTAGCSVVTSLPDSTVCFCNHTTNFAVLLQVYEMPVSEQPFSAALWGGCKNCTQHVANLWGFCVFWCFVFGAEDHQGGDHTADLDFYWMWSFLLCPDCYLYFILGSRVRKFETLDAFSVFLFDILLPNKDRNKVRLCRWVGGSCPVSTSQNLYTP